MKLLRFLKLRLAIKECLKCSIKNTQQLSPDELHTTTSRIDYLKVFPNVQWVWTAHYLKTLLSAWIIPDYSWERIHWSSHWTTYFGWFLLRWFETKCCCTGFCSLPYNGDCQDSIRYWKDSLDFGQTPVSEWHSFTVLYFLYFQSCLLNIRKFEVRWC